MKGPVRWLDQSDALPEELLASMRAYTEQGPSARELAMVRAGLQPAALPVALKMLALVVTIGGLTAWLVWPSSPTRPIAPATIAAPVAPAPPPPQDTPAPAVTSEPPPSVRARAATSPRPKVAREKVPPETIDPAAELKLLQRARRAVIVTPAIALALSEEHARTYPRGVFAEERELIAIEALSHTDRAAAVARARAFTTRFPHSAHRARIEVLLGAH